MKSTKNHHVSYSMNMVYGMDDPKILFFYTAVALYLLKLLFSSAIQPIVLQKCMIVKLIFFLYRRK